MKIHKSASGRMLFLAIIVSISLFISPTGLAHAQTLYGSLVGQISDSTGAVLPGVSVTVVNIGTGVTQTVQAGDNGSYSVGQLIPGTYKVTFTSQGFATSERTGVEVAPNTAIRLEITMNPGVQTETVNVASQATLLQTETAAVTSELSSKEVANLPLSGTEGRSFQSLYKIVPGFAPPQEANSSAANPQRSMISQVNGTDYVATNTKIDGANLQSPWLPQHVAYIPPADGIETVNIVTNAYDAEQGMVGGAAVNIILKSGTNKFHGNMHEYHTDNSLKALNRFNPAGYRKPKNILNQFGATLGGPLVKDKLFFFGSWETTRQIQGLSSTFTVAPLALRPDSNGDISFAGTGTTIYDPNTGAPASGTSTATPRTAFSGNVIPASRVSPAALTLIKSLPEPNTNGTTFGSNYFASASSPYNRDTYDVKVNWFPSPKTTAFAHYGYTGNLIDVPFALGAAGGPTIDGTSNQPGSATGRTQSATLGGTYTATPNLVFDGVFGYTRQRTGAQGPDYGSNYGLDVLDIPGTNGTTANQSGMPAFNFSSITSLGNSQRASPFLFRDSNYVGTINGSWKKGVHAFRFGFDYNHSEINHFQSVSYVPRGQFGFYGGVTSQFSGSPTIYNQWADFVLGLTTEADKGLQVSDPNALRLSVWSGYVQDHWQPTSKLTINFGLRYEIYPLPGTDHTSGPFVFDPSTGLVRIGGLGSTPRDAGVHNGHGMVVPRLGLVYRASDKWVIRAGYGLSPHPSSFRFLTGNYPQQLNAAFPSGSSYDPYASLTTGTTLTPYPNLSVGIPTLTIPDYSSGSVALAKSASINTPALDYHRGYIQSDNLSVQGELGWGFTGEVAYVGTHTVRQPGLYDINHGLPGGGTASRLLNSTFGLTGTISQVTPQTDTNYNALQSRLTRRLGNNGTIGFVYTYSKAMNSVDNSDSSLMFYDSSFQKNYAVASYDRTHNFDAYGVYDLPFGKNQPFLKSGLASKVLGGFQLNGVFTALSGTPFTVSAPSSSLNAPGWSQVADQVKHHVAKYGTIATGPWFDTSAYAAVTTARVGTSARNGLRGPGLYNADLSVFRTFPIREVAKLQFQLECFGCTNTPHFGTPDSTVGDANFGKITSTQSVGVAGSATGGERLIWVAANITF